MTIRSPQDCSASEFEIVPDVLGHARAREEQHLQAAEELVAKLRLPPEIGNEFFEAFRHIEINRGRDLAQIPHGFGDPVWRRLATVDIIGAAVEEHDADIVVAAEGVVPGQPVDDNRRFVPEKWKRCQDHGLVGADHAVRVDDALGQSRRSRGEQEFRDGVRPHGGVGRIGFGSGRCCKQLFEQHDPAVRRRIDRDRDLRIGGDHGVERPGEGRAIGGENKARRGLRKDVLELAEVGGKQRVGRRHRHKRNARVKAGQIEQQVLQIVAGQDKHRAFGRQAPLDQGRGKRANLGEGCGISEFAPGAIGAALREKQPVRRQPCPAFQRLGQFCRVWRQRLF